MKIFKAELFRLTHERKYRMLLISAVVLAILQTIVFALGMNYLKNIELNKLSIFKINAGYEFGLFKVKDIKNIAEMTLNEILVNIICKNGLAIYVAFVISFYLSEFSEKIVKYLKIKKYSDTNIFLSMTALVLVVSNFIFGVYFFSLMFSCGSLLHLEGGAVAWGIGTWKLIGFVWIQMNFYVLFVTMVSLFCQRIVVAVVINIGMILSFTQAMKFIEMILNKEGIFQGYWMLSQIESLFLSGESAMHFGECIGKTFCFAFVCFLLNGMRIKMIGKEMYY